MDALILRLLLSTIPVSFCILLILFFKKIFAEQLSPQMHHKIWLFIAVPPVFALFPWSLFQLEEKLQHLKNLFSSGSFQHNATSENILDTSGQSQAHGANALHDFAVSVNKATPDLLFKTLIIIWFIGIAIFFILALYTILRVHKLKKSAWAMKNRRILDLFDSCKDIVGVKRNIILRRSPLVSSPVTLGVIKPYILLPAAAEDSFSLTELKYVFLHELCHQKNNDVLMNYMMWLLQTVYWFNPLVWHSLKKVHIDRELACDASVLERLDENSHIEYGQTIIRFAGKKQDRSYGNFSTGIGGTKQQIKHRILRIASFSRKTKASKWKNRAIFFTMSCVVLLLAPLTAAFASSDDIYHFNGKNVVYEDADSYFKDGKGSFVLYDAAKKKYHIYNQHKAEQRVSPDSTYKIFSGLIALEEKVITPGTSDREWDGSEQPFQAWNRDQNLHSAMSDSVNWYFQELDREIGAEGLQRYFHQLQYGNEDLSGGMDSYWMESSLKISPIEQVQLLYALNENKMDFQKENINAIKHVLFLGEHHQHKLYGKTGTGTVNGKDVNGWFIGFVTTTDNNYYFAVHLQDENGKANGSKAKKIAFRILQDKQLYETR